MHVSEMLQVERQIASINRITIDLDTIIVYNVIINNKHCGFYYMS